MIGPHNADRIRAPIIAEVANGPVVGSVDAVLRERGITVLPDVLVNAGGVTVSYFEWVQNRQGYPWTLEQVRTRLEAVLVGAFEEIWTLQEEAGISFRAAAYWRGLRRIASAIESHGSRKYFAGEE